MAAKGSLAKTDVINKIKKAFGADYVGEFDKKVYVWAQDGNERVQIAISLTCPKNPVSVVSEDGFGINFDNPTAAPSVHEPTEFTQEEKDNIASLMKALGL